MLTLNDVMAIGREERCLAVVATMRGDSSIQSSVVSAGTLRHPRRDEEVVGFVTYGKTKLANLRARSQITVTFRSAGRWATVEGHAELIGPEDPAAGFSPEEVRLLLREVFVAAGGEHDDWEAYDRVMAEQRRTVVLVEVSRIYSNRPH